MADRCAEDRARSPRVGRDLPAGAVRRGDPLRWYRWLSDADAEQAARRVALATPLKGLPTSGKALASGTALILGLGAVGGVAFEVLARSGVGTLLGVDPDCYGAESFLTQPSVWADRGRPKAWVQGRRAQAANPAVRVRTAIGYAEQVPLRVLRSAAVLLVAGDSVELPRWVARRAAALGRPMVQAAVHGETGLAIVRGYALQDPRAACPGCSDGAADRVRREDAGCDPYTMRRAGQMPTRTQPTICGLAGQLLANEALKWLAGLEAYALRGEECTYCLWTHRFLRTHLPARPDRCELAHEQYCLVDLRQPFADTTLAQLAAEIGLAEGPDRAATCAASTRGSVSRCVPLCGAETAVRRFARIGSRVGPCRCGTDLAAGPRGVFSVIPAARFAGLLGPQPRRAGAGRRLRSRRLGRGTVGLLLGGRRSLQRRDEPVCRGDASMTRNSQQLEDRGRRHAALREKALADVAGPRSFRLWKAAAFDEVYAMTERTSRLDLLQANLEGDFELYFGLAMPVPRWPSGDRLTLGDGVIFHLVYQDAWREEPPPGWGPLGVVAPQDIFHPNARPSLRARCAWAN